MAKTVPFLMRPLNDGVTTHWTAAATNVVAKLQTRTNMGYMVKADVIAIATDNYDEVNAYTITAAFKNDGGTLAQVGSTDIDVSIEGHAGWSADFTTSGTEIRVTFVTDDTTPVTVRVHATTLEAGELAPHEFGPSDNA